MRRLPLITSAMLVVTHGCNLRCRYCFVKKEPESMTLATAKAAARFLMDNARAAGVTPEINFFGGEPLLMFDSVMKPLVEWVHGELGEAMRFSVTTNGTLLPQRQEMLLAAPALHKVNVSLHAPEANGFGDLEAYLRGCVAFAVAASVKLPA